MTWMHGRLLGLLLAVAGLPLAVGQGEDQSLEGLLARQRALQAEMTTVRLTLLQENAELRELNERIQALQRTLMRKLDDQPPMIELRTKLVYLEAEIAKLRAPPK